MRTRTLANLRADARKRADVENATALIPDADVNEYINQGWTRIYGILCRTGENYYLTYQTFNTSPGTDLYALPSDHFQTKGVDVQISSGRYQAADRFQFERRNDYQSADWSWPTRVLYDLEGTNMRFVPAPSGAAPVRHWYYPAAVRLVNDADTLDGGNGWELYAVDWAALYCATKDENYELVNELKQTLAKFESDITKEAATRIQGQAPKVRRIRYKGRLWWPGRF